MTEKEESLTTEVNIDNNETVEALTAHFRKISRGRIVELPRWAQ